jgi:membrane protein DedA with SNARE-associated domain
MANLIGYILWFTILLLAGWKIGSEIHAPIKPNIHPRHAVVDK